MTTTRRSFLQLLGGTAVATAVAPAIPKASPGLAAVGEVGTELVATTKSKGLVKVKWNPIDGASHYEVFIKRGNDTLVQALTKAERFVFDEPLEKGRVHYIRVRAVSAEGNKSEDHSVTIEGQEYDPTDYDWSGDID